MNVEVWTKDISYHILRSDIQNFLLVHWLGALHPPTRFCYHSRTWSQFWILELRWSFISRKSVKITRNCGSLDWVHALLAIVFMRDLFLWIVVGLPIYITTCTNELWMYAFANTCSVSFNMKIKQRLNISVSLSSVLKQLEINHYYCSYMYIVHVHVQVQYACIS